MWTTLSLLWTVALVLALVFLYDHVGLIAALANYVP